MANPAAAYDSICEIDQSEPNLCTDFSSLQVPPLDMDFLSNDFILPEGLMAELVFDDDFNFDDLSLSPENEGFLVEGSDVLVPSDPNACQDSGDRSSGEVARVLNFSSLDSGICNRESSGSFSFRDSGRCRSVVAGFLNSSPPDSGIVSASACFHNSSDGSSDVIAVDSTDQKIKLEEEGKACLPKRKKGKEDENPNPRNNKIHRSSSPSDNTDSSQQEEVKRKARLMRNRESAQLSRQRTKQYVEELEDKVRSMHSMIANLNSKISFIMAENASLRQQFGGGGVFPPPGGVYLPPSMATMPYTWFPSASYPMKPQGSQVPLVPIPRLKPQQPISASKAKKSESKKSESKTKKIASVGFLGLLLFVLIFGGLVHFVNVRYRGKGEMVPSELGLITNSFNGQRGSLLTGNGYINGSDQSVGVELCTGKPDFREDDDERLFCERSWTEGAESEVEPNNQRSRHLPGSNGFVSLGNASEPLVASLYVPRNDKLVRIDGNLIIHSVLAGEKAMASSRAAASGVNSHKATVSSANEAIQTSLAIAENLGPALAKGGKNVERHSHLYRSSAMRQNALTSGSRDAYKDNPKSDAADGSLQKWFREGMAGPILSSGMCTEVFQFEVSPDSSNPGAMIPSSSIANVSAKHQPGSAHLSKRMNRRNLNRIPIPLAGSAFNKTEEHVGQTSMNDNFNNNNNKSVSSMVVSVLFDPKGADDSGAHEVISSPKPLSQIFVVVLLDSGKYVTYSCMLPLKGSLVTT